MRGSRTPPDAEVRRLALVSLQRSEALHRTRPRWKPPLPLRLLAYLGLLLLGIGVFWVLSILLGVNASAY